MSDELAYKSEAAAGYDRAFARVTAHFLPTLLAALRTLGDAPARSLTALAQRLGVSEVDAATVVAPLEEEPVPLTSAPASPFCP